MRIDVALKFTRHLDSTAVEVPIKFQSYWKGSYPNIFMTSMLQDFERFCSKTSVRLMNRCIASHRISRYFESSLFQINLVVRQQAFAWANVYPDLFPYTASLSLNEVKEFNCWSTTTLQVPVPYLRHTHLVIIIMTSSNGNIFRVTGHLCGEFTGPRWIPHTKASDAELCCFLWSTSE